MPDPRTFDPSKEAIDYLIEQFHLEPGPGRLNPVARGAMGRLWRLSLAGADYAVKELFWGADEAAVSREVSFRDAAADAGVVSPTNLLTKHGRYVCTLPAELGSTSVRMFSWVEGRLVDRDDHGLSEWVGHTLGVLHSLRHPCDGVTPDPWYDHVPESTQWYDLLSQAEAASQPWASQLAKHIPLLLSLTELVVPLDPADLIYSHLDLALQNVMLDASGGYVLLDWEDAGPCMPDRNLAPVLCDWGIHDGAVDAGRVRRILEAYHDAGGYASLTGLESFTAGLAGYLNYIVAQASISLDTTQAPDMRDHASQELSRALRTPGLDLFRDLLHVVHALGKTTPSKQATR